MDSDVGGSNPDVHVDNNSFPLLDNTGHSNYSSSMSAPPEYCATIDETMPSSKEELPPVYAMDVNNLTWQRTFPPTYDDEERQIDEPLRSIELEIDGEPARMYRCGPCMLSETKSFLLCFFTVFLGILILLPTLFFITVLTKDQDPNIAPSA